MSQTKEGAKQAAQTNLAKDPDFYKKIGSIGGSKGSADGVIKGFAAMSYEKRARAGTLGGRISRRRKANDTQGIQ